MDNFHNDREPWLTTDQAATYLGKSANWLRNYAKDYQIPRSRLGRQYRYKASELEQWLRSRR